MCAGRVSWRDPDTEVDEAASDASRGVEKAASEAEGASKSRALDVASASDVWSDMKAGESQ